MERISIENLEAADLLLFGRTPCEGTAAHWTRAEGAVARLVNRVPKVESSRTLAAADGSGTRLIRDEAVEEAARLKREPGRDVLIFWSEPSRDPSSAGLVDECRIAATPVVPGEGRPLFGPGAARTSTRLLDAAPLRTVCIVLRDSPEPAA